MRSRKPAPEMPEILAFYLSAIGTAGGVASGVSRRQDRELAEAGTLEGEALERYERRKEIARKAIATRWKKG